MSIPATALLSPTRVLSIDQAYCRISTFDVYMMMKNNGHDVLRIVRCTIVRCSCSLCPYADSFNSEKRHRTWHCRRPIYEGFELK
jgi:hypothetical protein